MNLYIDACHGLCGQFSLKPELVKIIVASLVAHSPAAHNIESTTSTQKH